MLLQKKKNRRAKQEAYFSVAPTSPRPLRRRCVAQDASFGQREMLVTIESLLACPRWCPRRCDERIMKMTMLSALASNQAQPLLIWWRRDLGLGASKNRRICNHYVFKVVSQNLAYWQRVVHTWADVAPGAERRNSHRCTCMLTMLNSEKTLVLYVLRLGRFVSSMSWCLESALRRCELRHSVTLKAELRRSIEVVLAGHHFVADLSTWFLEVTDLSAPSFCFDHQSGGILVLLKKNSGSLAHSLSSSLQCYRIMFLSFLKKKKKKKKKDRGRIFQQRGRQIYARSGKNLLACILSHPSRSETVKDVLFIRRKESMHTCAKQESWFNKRRIDVAFSSGCTSRRHFGPSLGLWRAIPRVGELPFLKGFSLWTDQSERVYFYWPPGPNPVVTISTRVGPGHGSRLLSAHTCPVPRVHKNKSMQHHTLRSGTAEFQVTWPPKLREGTYLVKNVRARFEYRKTIAAHEKQVIMQEKAQPCASLWRKTLRPKRVRFLAIDPPIVDYMCVCLYIT